MSNSRTRMVAVAGSLALSLSMVSAPAVLAQDTPQDTLEGLMATIEAKDFEALPTFFCEEFAEEMGGLDFASLADEMPPGLDPNTLLDAFIFDAEIASMETISETEDEVIVQLEGSMSMDINAEAMGPFIEAMMEMSGMEVTPETAEMFTGLVMSEFEGESTDISAPITLVPGETMAWLVCSELSGDDDETTDGEMPAGETVVSE
jgi:hypothetical protein